jgi:hypothetical protein
LSDDLVVIDGKLGDVRLQVIDELLHIFDNEKHVCIVPASDIKQWLELNG